MVKLSRRACVAGLAAFGAKPAYAAKLPRTVSLDWGLTETLLALDAPPAGAAEVPSYNLNVQTYRLPQSVTDVGLRLSPDMETLQLLAPDLILVNNSQTAQFGQLRQIAPVWPLTIYGGDGLPLPNARQVTAQLGARLNKEVQSAALLARLDSVLLSSKVGLEKYDQRPLYIFSFLDARHIALYDRSSMAGGVIEALGLCNAWRRASGGWGVVPLPVEALAATPEARFICFGPVPEDATQMMRESPLWHGLPAIKAGRIRQLPPVWNYGAVPTASYMTMLLVSALMTADA